MDRIGLIGCYYSVQSTKYYVQRVCHFVGIYGLTPTATSTATYEYSGNYAISWEPDSSTDNPSMKLLSTYDTMPLGPDVGGRVYLGFLEIPH